MHDILLRNALIADPEADSLRTGDVAVEGGCIVEAIGSACTTIDCSPASSTRMCILVLIP